jgi:hypothetical protein
MKTIILNLIMALILFAGTIDAADDWTQKYPDPHPSAREEHAMAYIGGDQVLLFGGQEADESYNDETWIYDLGDNTWTQKNPSTKPSPRRMHSMSYIGGNCVLLFGGRLESAFDDETWIYDLSANTWTQRIPLAKPSARLAAAMVYIGEDQALLFGGMDASGYNDETWVYYLGANTWLQLYPSSNPSGRYNHAMAYIGDNQVLLFGGKDCSWPPDDETWIYDVVANTWTQKTPLSQPSGRDSHAMAYIGDDQVLLFGGFDGYYNDETWVYDLSDDNWTQDENSEQPSARWAHGLSETSIDGSSHLVLFSGYEVNPDYYDDETWTFGGGDYLVPVEHGSFTAALPKTCQLFQNYPNPFNTSTEIRYQVPEDAHVTLKIFNTLVQEVRTLVDTQQESGEYRVIWNGQDENGYEVASGLYFCRLSVGNFSKTTKMVLIK